MARRKGFRVPGVTFSWKRALGISAAKGRIARATGIPTTRAGRQRKLGRMAGCGGCLLPVLVIVITTLVVVTGV